MDEDGNPVAEDELAQQSQNSDTDQPVPESSEVPPSVSPAAPVWARNRTIPDPDGDQQFSNMLFDLERQIKDGQTNGLSPRDLLDPASQYYIGDRLIAAHSRTPSERLAAWADRVRMQAVALQIPPDVQQPAASSNLPEENTALTPYHAICHEECWAEVLSLPFVRGFFPDKPGLLRGCMRRCLASHGIFNY